MLFGERKMPERKKKQSNTTTTTKKRTSERKQVRCCDGWTFLSSFLFRQLAPSPCCTRIENPFRIRLVDYFITPFFFLSSLFSERALFIYYLKCYTSTSTGQPPNAIQIGFAIHQFFSPFAIFSTIAHPVYDFNCELWMWWQSLIFNIFQFSCFVNSNGYYTVSAVDCFHYFPLEFNKREAHRRRRTKMNFNFECVLTTANLMHQARRRYVKYFSLWVWAQLLGKPLIILVCHSRNCHLCRTGHVSLYPLYPKDTTILCFGFEFNLAECVSSAFFNWLNKCRNFGRIHWAANSLSVFFSPNANKPPRRHTRT